MNDKAFDSFLTQGLRHNSHYLDDNGFTLQVMQALPAKRRVPRLLERLILALPATLVAFVVLFQLPWHDLLHPIYAQLLTLDATHLFMSGAALIVFAVAIPAYWVLNKTSSI